MENYISFLYNKNPLLVLSYLTKEIYKENTVTTVAKELQLSVGSVHSILKNFEMAGIIKSRLLGKNVIYEIDMKNPILKSFRVFDNIAQLLPMVEQLKKVCRKVILFGSCSRGDDTNESDIDLFVLTNEEQYKVSDIIKEFDSERQINPVIVNIFEEIEMEKNDKVFFKEIMKGIILWEEEGISEYS